MIRRLFNPTPATPEGNTMTALATAAPAPDLPLGYDDPNSDYFVPEPLRDHYVAATADGRQVLGKVDELARIMARERLDAEHVNIYPPHMPVSALVEMSASIKVDQTARAQRGQQLVDQIKTDKLPDLMERARHSIRLKAARAAHAAAERAEQQRAQIDRTDTCPLCTMRGGGMIAQRSLDGYDVRNPGSAAPVRRWLIHSCASCYDQAAELVRTHRARQIAADGRTRADIVGDHLDALLTP